MDTWVVRPIILLQAKNAKDAEERIAQYISWADDLFVGKTEFNPTLMLRRPGT